MRAIAYGVFTDVFLTKLWGLILLIALLDPGSSTTAPIDYLSMPAIEQLSLLVGLATTAAGAFVAARLAGPRLGLLHGLAVGLASLVVSHLFFGWAPAEVGLAIYAVGTGATLPCAATGAVLAGAWKNTDQT